MEEALGALALVAAIDLQTWVRHDIQLQAPVSMRNHGHSTGRGPPRVWRRAEPSNTPEMVGIKPKSRMPRAATPSAGSGTARR